MKTILVVFLTVGVALNSIAHAETLDACDLLYSHRGAVDLMASAECYGSLVATSDGDQKRALYERSFIALSAVVNDSPKTQSEIDAISKALKLVEEMGKAYSTTADYLYWRAVFTSFDAIQRDRGSILPRHLFAVLRSIQDDLGRSIELDPTLHVYGPHRVLGIMHTQMPGIVGGDKVLAEKMLREAYTRAPNISLNHIAYARILQVNGKDELAKGILTRFLALTDSELDPYPSAPLRSVKPELNHDRIEAKKLLEELNGE